MNAMAKIDKIVYDILCHRLEAHESDHVALIRLTDRSFFRKVYRFSHLGESYFVKLFQNDGREIETYFDTEGHLHSELSKLGFDEYVPRLAKIQLATTNMPSACSVHIYKYVDFNLNQPVTLGGTAGLISRFHSTSRFVERPPQANIDPILQFLRNKNDEYLFKRLHDILSNGDNIFIHGDLRDDNIMAKHHEYKLIDFEFSRYSHRLMDLASLVCFYKEKASLIRRSPEVELRSFLRSYHDNLRKNDYRPFIEYSYEAVLLAGAALHLYIANQLLTSFPSLSSSVHKIAFELGKEAGL